MQQLFHQEIVTYKGVRDGEFYALYTRTMILPMRPGTLLSVGPNTNRMYATEAAKRRRRLKHKLLRLFRLDYKLTGVNRHELPHKATVPPTFASCIIHESSLNLYFPVC